MGVLNVLQVSTLGREGMKDCTADIDDLLDYYRDFLNNESEGTYFDEFRYACNAGEYTVALIIALSACQDQNLKPDPQVLHDTLASSWCHHDIDAYKLGCEVLEKTESANAS